jgi:hypothetical protein
MLERKSRAAEHAQFCLTAVAMVIYDILITHAGQAPS